MGMLKGNLGTMQPEARFHFPIGMNVHESCKEFYKRRYARKGPRTLPMVSKSKPTHTKTREKPQMLTPV